MRLKELIGELQRCNTWAKPRVELEQYPTPPDIAAHMLLAAAEEGDIEGKLIADLGCGGGVLGIGAALLGAEHVLAVDLDPAALEVAAENVAEAEVPVDLLHCDVTHLAARSRSRQPQVPAAAPATSEPTVSSLPCSFLESRLPTKVEYEASLGLSDSERIALEEDAMRKQLQRMVVTPPPAAATAVKPSHAALPSSSGGCFDCVLMNPPFGTQKNSNGLDVAFLRAGIALCASGGAVYSLHKTSTRKFIEKHATAEWGAEDAKVVAELKFAIPKMYKHHKKASLDVEVDFWRLGVG